MHRSSITNCNQSTELDTLTHSILVFESADNLYFPLYLAFISQPLSGTVKSTHSLQRITAGSKDPDIAPPVWMSARKASLSTGKLDLE